MSNTTWKNVADLKNKNIKEYHVHNEFKTHRVWDTSFILKNHFRRVFEKKVNREIKTKHLIHSVLYWIKFVPCITLSQVCRGIFTKAPRVTTTGIFAIRSRVYCRRKTRYLPPFFTIPLTNGLNNFYNKWLGRYYSRDPGVTCARIELSTLVTLSQKEPNRTNSIRM